MFTRLENGAEVEMEVVTFVENGAEVEAEGVGAVKDGAEEEVWASLKKLDLINSTMASGSVTSPSAWGEETNISPNNGGGLVAYTTKGNWNNPTVEFEFDGFYAYENSSGNILTASAGHLYAYGVRSDGTVDKIGGVTVDTYDSGEAQTFSQTFSAGDYVEVGFQFTSATYGSIDADKFRMQHVNIRNILIDGVKYITDSADDF